MKKRVIMVVSKEIAAEVRAQVFDFIKKHELSIPEFGNLSGVSYNGLVNFLNNVPKRSREKTIQKLTSFMENNPNLKEKLKEARATRILEVHEKTLTFLNNNPGYSKMSLARRLNLSSTTLYSFLNHFDIGPKTLALLEKFLQRNM